MFNGKNVDYFVIIKLDVSMNITVRAFKQGSFILFNASKSSLVAEISYNI